MEPYHMVPVPYLPHQRWNGLSAVDSSNLWHGMVPYRTISYHCTGIATSSTAKKGFGTAIVHLSSSER
eukprot:scaffold15632_cov224-Amphora_coffeaeformis.AAC.1